MTRDRIKLIVFYFSLGLLAVDLGLFAGYLLRTVLP